MPCRRRALSLKAQVTGGTRLVAPSARSHVHLNLALDMPVSQPYRTWARVIFAIHITFLVKRKSGFKVYWILVFKKKNLKRKKQEGGRENKSK